MVVTSIYNLSSQVKRDFISSTKHFAYQLPHELSMDLKLRILIDLNKLDNTGQISKSGRDTVLCLVLPLEINYGQ